MAETTPICAYGWRAPDFRLQGTDGRLHALADLKGPKGTLVMFICNHCPYVQAVIDRIGRDTRELATLGISSVAISSNDAETYPDDSFERMKAAPAEWRLLPAPSGQKVLGHPHTELSKRASAGGCIAEVSWFDEEATSPMCSSFDIVLPEVTFQRAYSLLSEAFFGSRRCTYQLSIGFLTFRRPTAIVDLPTLTEFLSGRPYFSDDVSIAIQSAESDDA